MSTPKNLHLQEIAIGLGATALAGIGVLAVRSIVRHNNRSSSQLISESIQRGFAMATKALHRGLHMR